MTTATRYIGTCPVCYGEHKLHKMTIVHHGYQRPGDGFIHGDCFGVGWAPFELSPDGTIAYVERVLQPDLVASTKFLQRAEAGEVTQVIVKTYESVGWGKREPVFKTLTVADREFERALRVQVINTENHVRHLAQDITERTQKVAAWRKEPVRTEEEVVQARERMTSEKRTKIQEARDARAAKRAALDAKQQAREQERLDLIAEYRDIFERLAVRHDADTKAAARGHWAQMHKRMNKKGYLHFYPHKLEAEPALVVLGLAAPSTYRQGAYDYANSLGWLP